MEEINKLFGLIIMVWGVVYMILVFNLNQVEAHPHVSPMIVGTCEVDCLEIMSQEEWEAKTRNPIVDQVHVCESSAGLFMVGDDGDSLGHFQFQQATLSEIMGKYYGYEVDLTYYQWEAIAYDYDESRFWFEYAWFDLDLSNKWWNTKLKMKKGLCI